MLFLFDNFSKYLIEIITNGHNPAKNKEEGPGRLKVTPNKGNPIIFHFQQKGTFTLRQISENNLIDLSLLNWLFSIETVCNFVLEIKNMQKD